MTIERDKIERMLTDLQQELAERLASWTWPSGVDADEILVESIEALWVAKEVNKKTIRMPIRWLLSTARHLKFEKSRSVRASRVRPLADHDNAHHNENNRTICGSADSTTLAVLEAALAAFGSAKQFAITEILMFDRGVTEVARELGVKRSTVNGWICRLPKRLAKLDALQAFVPGGESSTSKI